MSPSLFRLGPPLAAWLAASGLVTFPAPATAAQGHVRLQRVPEDGRQPDAMVDATGRVHLLYLTGDPKAADIHYTTRAEATAPWAPPLTVNSQPGSAIAIGTVRGPRLSLGRSNVVHVVWNGSGQPQPRAKESAPLLYSRLSPGAAAFEPQRPLGGETRHLDGGSAVAADPLGTVLVAWHAAPPQPPPGGDDESKRAVFIAVSRDSGRTFDEPRRIDEPGGGVCACCGLAANFGPAGRAFVAYRSAEGGSERGMVLLTSADRGETFSRRRLDHWELTQCPMTTVHLTPTPAGMLAAWSSHGAPQLAQVDDSSAAADLSAPGRRANHPVAAYGQAGQILMAWTEGTGWQKGGDVAWQILAPGLKPQGEIARHPGVPVWGYVTAWAERDGSFTILH